MYICVISKEKKNAVEKDFHSKVTVIRLSKVIAVFPDELNSCKARASKKSNISSSTKLAVTPLISPTRHLSLLLPVSTPKTISWRTQSTEERTQDI